MKTSVAILLLCCLCYVSGICDKSVCFNKCRNYDYEDGKCENKECSCIKKVSLKEITKREAIDDEFATEYRPRPQNPESNKPKIPSLCNEWQCNYTCRSSGYIGSYCNSNTCMCYTN